MYKRGKQWQILLVGFGAGILCMLMVFLFINQNGKDKDETIGEVEETEQILETTETEQRNIAKEEETEQPEQSEAEQSEITEETETDSYMAGSNMTVPKSFVKDLRLYEYIEYGVRKYNEANRQDIDYACDIEEDILPYDTTALIMKKKGDEPFKTDLAKEMIPELSNRIFQFKLNGQDDTKYMQIDTYNMKIYVYDGMEEKSSVMDKSYGCYRITQFYFTQYYSARKYDVMPDQEADMLIGKVVIIKPDILVTYDTERCLGTREGRNGFEGNYMIEKQVLEYPEYDWQDITNITDSFLLPDADMKWAMPDEYFDQVTGVICIPDLCKPYGTQYYYTLEDPDKLIMLSTLTFQYFLLERCEDEDLKELEEISQEEQRDILENCYGEYQVVEFLPTKFWPALDSSLNVILPKEEAELMLRRKIILSEKLFHTYDNFRQPNSEFVDRLEDGYWLKDVDIINPDYQIKKVRYEDIYGIRDGMLAKELTQEEYIEIDVFPGYKANEINNLPQLYVVDDGRIIMYSMGEYFLLEKIKAAETELRDTEKD